MENINLLCPICGGQRKRGSNYVWLKTCGTKECRYELTNRSNDKASKTLDELINQRRLRQKRQYNKNPEKFRERNKRLRIQHIENMREYEKSQYEKHRAKRLLHKKQKYEANKIEILEQAKSKYVASVEQFHVTAEPYVRKLLTGCRTRSRKNKIPFDLTVEYLLSILPTVCPVLGIKLEPKRLSGNTHTAPSIDRLIPELGYVQGNVVIVSNRANTLRRNGTIDEFKKIVVFYEKELSHKTPL